MKEIIITEDTYKEVFKEILTSKEDLYWHGVVSKPCVIAGTYDKGNKEVAESLGYFVGQNVYTPGGTMVLNEGDVMFGVMRYRKGIGELSRLRGAFLDFLSSKGVKAKAVGNDILVDSVFKVAGISHKFIGLRKIVVFVISVHDTDNLAIRKICNKKSGKVPRGLATYNISSEEIIEFFKTVI